MAEVFSGWNLGKLEIPNRLVRSATWEGMALDNGAPSDDLIKYYGNLAQGGIGLIITGYAYVTREGMGLPKQTGIHDDAMIEPMSRLAAAVHSSGGKVALQIVHAGGQTRADWIGCQPLGPSKMLHPAFGEEVRELSTEGIHELVKAFAAAARRALEAGFDAVQLHGAHGYLINQFLSPNTNQRTDEYGGSLENRARFCYQVYAAARKEVGPDFPLFIKLNSEDALEGGLSLDDSLAVAGALSEQGIDGIEVSGGVPAAGKNSPSRAVEDTEQEAYFLANAQATKAAVSCPVIVVGGFRSRASIDKALQSLDAVAMCRPFIRQPDLAQQFKDGVSDKADCISCGRCFKASLKHGLRCGAIPTPE